MIFPLLLLLGLGLAYSNRKPALASAPRPTPKAAPIAAAAARILRESQEIADGSRQAFSDPSVESELAKAQAAAKLAKARESEGVAGPKPGSAMAKPKPKPPTQTSTSTDLAKAKATAPKVAEHLKKAGRANYSRQVLKLWQGRAGIAPDGIYGRGAAAALRYFTPGAPAAFFAQGVAQYKPPAG